MNKIHLRGIVGKADINTFPNNSQVCNFSVVTEYSTVDRDGNSVIEPTWFNVSIWNGKGGFTELYDIQKGVWVDVQGRLRTRRYTAQTGEERSVTEVIARSVQVLPREDENLQPQKDY